MSEKQIVHQPHWRTTDVAKEIERDGYMVRQYYTQEWTPPVEPADPLIEKRAEFYQRFAPEAAERHWQRWLEQRAAIDREFDRTHPYWREQLKRDS